MDYQQIEYFLMVKQYEHVAMAADRLGISPSALSKRISALEAELGCKLFERVSRRIRLNTNGEIFAEYAEKSLDLLRAGQMALKSTMYESSGHIHIQSYTYAPILSDCINEYSELNPKVTIQVTTGELPNGLQNPDFELRAIIHPEYRMKREEFWVGQPLFRENTYLVSSPDYPIQVQGENGQLADIAAWKDADFITMERQDKSFSDITYTVCQNAGFFPRAYGRTDDFLIKIKWLKQARGVALLPESCLEDVKLWIPGMRYYALQDEICRREIYLMHPKRNMMTEIALDFYEFVLDYYELKQEEHES